MAHTLDWSDYLVFAFWLVIYSLVGIYHRYRKQIHSKWNSLWRKQSTVEIETCDGATEALFFGNRKLTLFPVTCSVIASFLSAISLMGTATEAYRYGIQFFVMIIPYIAAFSIASEVYMPVFYKLRLKSAQEYLEFRFGKVLRWMVAVVFCFQMLAYISLVLYAPGLAFSQVSGLPMWITLISTGLVTTFYTAMGGLRAVVWTDVIQLCLLTFGMVLIIILGTIKVGGVQQLWLISLEGLRLQSFSFDPNPFIRHTVWTLAFGGTGMVLSIYATNQTQVQRYLACRDLKTARLSLLLNIPFNCLFLAVQLVTGLIIYAYFVGCDPIGSKQVKQPDQLLPYFIMVLFDGIPVVRGLLLSVIFAAVLSTVSSGVNSLANVILEDIIRPICYLCGKKQFTVTILPAMLLSSVTGLCTIGLAFLYTAMGPLLLQFSFSIFGAVGGPVFAVFSLGILIPCINSKGAISGFVCSLAVGLWLSLGAILYPTFTPPLPLSTDNCSAFNVTFTPTLSAAPSGPVSFNIYAISYLYYTPICLLVAVLVGLVVSAIFGFNTKSPVPSCLLAWQAAACYRRCPSIWASRQWIESDAYVLNSGTKKREQSHESAMLFILDHRRSRGEDPHAAIIS